MSPLLTLSVPRIPADPLLTGIAVLALVASVVVWLATNRGGRV